LLDERRIRIWIRIRMRNTAGNLTVRDVRDTGPVPESVANSGEASRFNTDDEDTR
jgi:hypothetical protein